MKLLPLLRGDAFFFCRSVGWLTYVFSQITTAERNDPLIDTNQSYRDDNTYGFQINMKYWISALYVNSAHIFWVFIQESITKCGIMFSLPQWDSFEEIMLITMVRYYLSNIYFESLVNVRLRGKSVTYKRCLFFQIFFQVSYLLTFF